MSGLAVFNRYGLRALAGITDINAPVSARIIRHDEIDAHPKERTERYADIVGTC